MSLELRLRVLWLKNSLGLAIDSNTEKSTKPITIYYFWPKTDAWEQLKLELGCRPWIKEIERIKILNTASRIMDLWKNSNRLIAEELKLKEVTFIRH